MHNSEAKVIERVGEYAKSYYLSYLVLKNKFVLLFFSNNKNKMVIFHEFECKEQMLVPHQC